MASHTTKATARLRMTQQHLTGSSCKFTTSATSANLSKSAANINIKDVSSVSRGSKYTTEYKNYAVDGQNQVISWFHDVPLNLDIEAAEANIVVEIPRWSNAKFEIDTKLPGNPIVQDVKKGAVRFVKNLFPHHGYIHNYGALPQTWEDPTHKDEALDLYGDNDPVDVCEIGSAILTTGLVKRVKILGSIALIDDGELDWKVIVIDVNDPLAENVNDIHHLYTRCPGLLETTRQWFRDYKLADGKPQNKFAYNGQYRNKKETLQLIQDCNKSWYKLITGQTKGQKLPSIENATLVGTPGYNGGYRTQQLLVGKDETDAPIPVDIQRNHFIPTD